jgi:hypothetical protein
MKRNLDVSRYRNGDRIPQVKTLLNGRHNHRRMVRGIITIQPMDASMAGYTNWYAVHEPERIGPKGWHVPRERMDNTNNVFRRGCCSGWQNERNWNPHLADQHRCHQQQWLHRLPGGYRSHILQHSTALPLRLLVESTEFSTTEARYAIWSTTMASIDGHGLRGKPRWLFLFVASQGLTSCLPVRLINLPFAGPMNGKNETYKKCYCRHPLTHER